jgi:hypothetical protein
MRRLLFTIGLAAVLSFAASSFTYAQTGGTMPSTSTSSATKSTAPVHKKKVAKKKSTHHTPAKSTTPQEPVK